MTFVLFSLIQADGLLGLFESLPEDLQMEGLDVFQEVVNKVVSTITHGR